MAFQVTGGQSTFKGTGTNYQITINGGSFVVASALATGSIEGTGSLTINSEASLIETKLAINTLNPLRFIQFSYISRHFFFF